VRILGLSLREHVGGRWAMSWLLLLIYLPIGLLAPLGNLSTSVPGTTVGQLLAASGLSLIPVVALLLISDYTWMRYRAARPLPIWSVVLLGLIVGISRSASMYVASVNLGIQDPNAEIAVTRIISGGVQGITVYPLAILLVSIIARYTAERRRLLTEQVRILEREQRDEQQWRQTTEEIIAPLSRDLTALGDRLDADQIGAEEASREIREHAHVLWEQARVVADPPRLRFRDALVASLRRRPFASLLIMAVWFPTALGTVLAVSDDPLAVVGLVLSSTIAVGIFEAGNALVRRSAAWIWIVLPAGIGLSAFITSPTIQVIGALPERSRLSYFIINIVWLTLITLGTAVVTGAVRQGEAILDELHDRVDAEHARAISMREHRRSVIDRVATSLHGQLQPRLAAVNGPVAASEAIRDAVTLLERAQVDAPHSLRSAIDSAVSEWRALMTISVSVSGEAATSDRILARDIIAEALSNAFRHGNASAVSIRVQATSDAVLIEASDNGQLKVGQPGLGSRLFDRAGEWERTGSATGTILRVRLRAT